MKTIALFTLLLGAGTMTVPSDYNVFRLHRYAPPQSINLTTDLISTEDVKVTAVPSLVLPKQINTSLKNQRQTSAVDGRRESDH
jgi:hypothetical protein